MDSKDLLEQLDSHLASPSISWLLGAGISVNANVPLMSPLTDRVIAVITEHHRPHLPLIEDLRAELPDECHIEHILSHIGDYATLALRAKTGHVLIAGKKVTQVDLDGLHREIVNAIACTVRWGYAPGSKDGTTKELVGERGEPITDIKEHREFVAVCFGTARAGLQERRGPVRLFTTNYDTLLEDALALNFVRHWDGFDGGAVAFRSFRLGDDEPPADCPAHVIKLHGSIDWHMSEDGRVWRVRHGDQYPEVGQRVLIYPQSSKYLAAQRDPFAAQFDLLRRTLGRSTENVVAVCGYSFGDGHINDEIELALARGDNKTTLLAFYREDAQGLAGSLDHWRKSPWGARVYIATQKGLYVGSNGPFFANPEAERQWWNFAGVTDVLRSGAGSIL